MEEKKKERFTHRLSMSLAIKKSKSDAAISNTSDGAGSPRSEKESLV
jgi:hypothetical protein